MIPLKPLSFDTEKITAFISSLFPCRWLQQQAYYSGFVQHRDSEMNVAILIQSMFEVFVMPHFNLGDPNTFPLSKLRNAYNSNVDKWNESRKQYRRPEAHKLGESAFRYYLCKPNFKELSRRIYDRCLSEIHKCANSLTGEAVLEALNYCLTQDSQLLDIVLYDGCYKKVHSALAEIYKAARTAQKPTLDENGNKIKTLFAQLGIQVGFSLLFHKPLYADITSATANERDWVRIKPKTLAVCDAGYLSYQMIKQADDNDAFILVQGKCNMRGRIKSILIDNEECGDCYCGYDLQDKRVKNISTDHILDIQVELTLKEQEGQRPDDKPINKKIRYIARVIRYQDARHPDIPSFLVTNLPSTISCKMVLSIMRLRWTIEQYFKELKSYTNYRGACTVSESLTTAFVYLSITTHLCRGVLIQNWENMTSSVLSLPKIANFLIPDGNTHCSISEKIVSMFSTFIPVSTLDKTIEALTRIVHTNFALLLKSKQSKKNVHKSRLYTIVDMLEIAIRFNPFNRDTENLRMYLSLLPKNA